MKGPNSLTEKLLGSYGVVIGALGLIILLLILLCAFVSYGHGFLLAIGIYQSSAPGRRGCGGCCTRSFGILDEIFTLLYFSAFFFGFLF